MTANIAHTAALLADPARANILTALMSGMALTAGELAATAGVTQQTASGHLSKLLEANFVAVAKQGRYRYYRLAGPEVATAIEALMALSNAPPGRVVRPGPKDEALRHARVCYDHLAGRLGVELLVRLSRQKYVVLREGSLAMTKRGEAALAGFGIDVDALKISKRPICLTCLDWSERSFHLAGGLGATLLLRLLELGWAKRIPGSRTVRFTRQGEQKFAGLFT